MNKRLIKFVGIDDFNRPIFKEIARRNYYGANDVLFSQGTLEKEVKEKVTEKDITFFGARFNCEPMGTSYDDIIIKWGE
jgi:hypothetical protein